MQKYGRQNINKEILTVILTVILILAVAAAGIVFCGSERKKPEGSQAAVRTATDYSDPSHWYQVPGITRDADTFYLYPTLYGGFKEGDDDYAAIDNEDMLSSVGSVYAGQASAFENCTNVFVPYYRQASMAHEIEAYNETGSLDAALEGIPLEDASAALDHYFENYNNGRPFILAGHSQGSALVKLLLKTYFRDHPEYYDRMVAAYIIGYSVTGDDLAECPYLKFASGETDTGVIVSWNAVGQKHVDANAHTIVALDNSVAINPLNWKTDETYAPASENLGSMTVDLVTGESRIEDVGADAQVNTELGVVVTHAKNGPKTASEYFGPQSYHSADYALYYMNIRENAARRIEAYMSLK